MSDLDQRMLGIWIQSRCSALTDTAMSRFAISPSSRRSVGVVVPFTLAVEGLDLSYPLSESAVRYVSEQLVAEYGSDALPLAIRHADSVFRKGDPIKYSDWCRLTIAIELIQHMNKWTTIEQT